MASTYLSRTPSSNGSDTIATFSAWLKKTANGSYEGVFTSYSSTSEYFEINFESGDSLEVRAKVSNSYVLRKITNRKFRDNSAFYHIVVAIDTTDSTEEDRCKIYVNGTRETSFSTNTNPSSSQDLNFNTTSHEHRVGRDEWSTPAYFDGVMAHVHWIDGTVYQASTFGETDSTSGIWKPKTAPSVTYGTNGFFLKFENSGAMGTDSSGNSNTFTVNGSMTQNVDSPSNSFCLFNRLDRWLGTTNNYGDYLSKGNNTVAMASANKGLVRGTLGVEAGKWYWEAQANSVSKGFYGMTNDLAFNTSSAPHDSTLKAGIYYYEGVPDFRYYSGAGEITTDAVSISADDILMFALDMDNKAFYIGKNGTWMASGDPTSGSSKTGAISEKFSNPTVWADSGPVFPAVYVSSTSGTIDTDYNFGNGNFGTTAVASANADGNGIGKFEYSVPSGYYAICTKNIKEFG